MTFITTGYNFLFLFMLFTTIILKVYCRMFLKHRWSLILKYVLCYGVVVCCFFILFCFALFYFVCFYFIISDLIILYFFVIVILFYFLRPHSKLLSASNMTE